MIYRDLICLSHSGLLFTVAVQKHALWIFVVLHYVCEIYSLCRVAGMSSFSLMYNILMFESHISILEVITFGLLPDWAVMINTVINIKKIYFNFF